MSSRALSFSPFAAPPRRKLDRFDPDAAASAAAARVRFPIDESRGGRRWIRSYSKRKPQKYFLAEAAAEVLSQQRMAQIDISCHSVSIGQETVGGTSVPTDELLVQLLIHI